MLLTGIHGYLPLAPWGRFPDQGGEPAPHGRLRTAASYAAVLVFWGVAGLSLLYRLGDFPLKDWDEAIYAEVSREILRTGDFLTLHYNHEYYFNKPPLYFWVSQLVIRLLGFSELSSRLPGVLFGALTLWATIRFGKDLGGSICGYASGAILLSTAMFLENASRHASPDSLLLFLTVAALWVQWRGRHVPGMRYLAVALLGFAFLTKGAAAAPLFITLALIHWLLGDYRTWTPGAYCRAALLFGAIVLPWYAVQTVLHGIPFWHKHVYFMVWERATRADFLHSRGPLYYTRFLLEQLRYLWPLGAMLIWIAVERRRGDLPVFLRAHKEASLTLLLAIVVPLVLFSAAKSHTWWYILPAVPPLCMVGGLTLETARRRLGQGMWRRVLFSTLVGVLAINGVSNATDALAGQIQNGLRVYGPQAQLAKRVPAYAAAMGMVKPIVIFPRESPSIAAYIPFRVVFDPHYPDRLISGAAALGSPPPDTFLLDKHQVIERLRRNVPITILEQARGWSLAVPTKGRVPEPARPLTERGDAHADPGQAERNP